MARVIAVTVTYGDRFATLCREAIDRAFVAGVETVVVVDNGSETASSVALQEYQKAQDGRVVVLRNEHNEGSAVAFGAALQLAAGMPCDYIWLLDDDNWASEDDLQNLILAQKDEAEYSGDPFALVSARRIPNVFHDAVANGIPARHVYPPAGSFLSFDVLTYVLRRVRRPATLTMRPRIPYAPYGGLLVKPEVVKEVGLPLTSFVLYSDDTEWTSRITGAGHAIVLVPEVVIQDAQGKWNEIARSNSIAASIASAQRDRLYLATRNRVRIDRRAVYDLSTSTRYALNKFVVFSAAWWGALRTSSWHGFATFRRAVRAGELSDSQRSH